MNKVWICWLSWMAFLIEYFHCDTFSNVLVNYPFLGMYFGRTDILIKSFSWCSFWRKIHGFYVWFNSQGIRIRCFLAIVLRFQCIFCIISCFNNQSYALITYMSWFSSNTKKVILLKLSVPRGSGISLWYGRTAYSNSSAKSVPGNAWPSTINFLFPSHLIIPLQPIIVCKIISATFYGSKSKLTHSGQKKV